MAAYSVARTCAERVAVVDAVGVAVGTIPERLTGIRLRDPNSDGTPRCPLPFVPQHQADCPAPIAHV